MIILHLRVHTTKDMAKTIMQWVASQSNTFLACFETDAARDHMHCMLLYLQSESKFRRLLNEKFLWLNRSNYSLATKDDREAQERYLCKGSHQGYSIDNPDIIAASRHYVEDLIIERHEQYWEIHRQLTKAVPTSSRANARSQTFVEIVVRELPSRKYDYHDAVDKRLVFNLVMQQLGTKGKTLDVLIVRRIINGVWNIIDPTRYRESIYEQVYPDRYDRVEY